MRILRPNNHELARLQIDVACGWLGIEFTVGCFVVGFGQVGAVLKRFPSYHLYSVERNMYVDVLAMNLKHLLVGCNACRIGVVDEQIVAVDVNASAWSVEQVVALDIVEYFLEQWVQRLDAVAMLKC